MPRYFVDGYNVIRCSDAFESGSLQSQRERFLRFIEDRLPQGSSANLVVVVFDGREDVSSPPWPGPTRVLFSHGRDADSLIKEQVDALSRPREAVVVTNDRAIQRWVRAAGAAILSSEAFLAAGAGPRPPAKKAAALSPDQARAINEELKDLWKLK